MLWLVLLGAVTEALLLRDPVTLSSRTGSLRQSSYQWSEEWLGGVPVDHFSFANKDSFSLRYFINTKNYQAGGPILFYTGNEGKLESFAENTV